MLDTVTRPPTAPDSLAMAAEIVAAYVSHNSVPVVELTGLLQSVHAALVSITSGPAAAPEPEVLKPAVPVKKSVHEEFIVCLENGKRFKSLKRHLATAYGLSPDEYRTKWGLPKDYPMVAPAYANRRSNLARQMGLGRKSGDAIAEGPKSEAGPDSAGKRSGERRPAGQAAQESRRYKMKGKGRRPRVGALRRTNARRVRHGSPRRCRHGCPDPRDPGGLA